MSYRLTKAVVEKIASGHGRFRAVAGITLAALGVLALIGSANAQPVSPALPVINTNNMVNILNQGAVGDGVTTNTTAIQNAINAAAGGGTTNGAKGGTVEIPAGVFLCGPLTLKSSVNIQLDSGAVLRMLSFGHYPLVYFTNVSGGVTNITWTAPNFIGGTNLTDIEISGSGMIDGQGIPWWPYANTNGDTRPIMIRLVGCNRELIENVTLTNSPEFHVSLSGSAGNTTIQGLTIQSNSSEDPVNPSHNTDGCDLSGTNILVQNCYINNGDDNIAAGSGTSGVLITNCTFGTGHGVSIGSFTTDGVSNMTVINCSFTGTDNGIRMKSDDGRGGLVQNISYYNLTMTNVGFPITIYSYYNEIGTPSGITPQTAASEIVSNVSSSTPIWRNIIISNLTATASSSGIAGIIWGRTELAVSNVLMDRVNISAPQTFNVYNARGIQFVDSQITVPAGKSDLTILNAGVILSNSAPGTNVMSFTGLFSANSLALYNAAAQMSDTNAFGNNPITLDASTLSLGAGLTLSNANALNYSLGTNAAEIAVSGNLTLAGSVTVANGGGFTNGTYTLFTYTSGLAGSLPTLASAPAGFNYAFDTNTTGQVNLDVTLPTPAPPANLTAIGTNLAVNLDWTPSTGATGYVLERSTTNGGTYQTITNTAVTNYSDFAVTPGVTYYYVVAATNSSGESATSPQASAAALPSLVPVSITLEIGGGGNLQLSWPADHLGWRLEIQTNSPGAGIGTNWLTVPNSTNVTQTNLVINPASGSVFLQLIYP